MRRLRILVKLTVCQVSYQNVQIFRLLRSNPAESDIIMSFSEPTTEPLGWIWYLVVK